MKKMNKRDLIYIPIISVLIIALLLVLLFAFKPYEISYYEKKCQSFETQNANLSKGQIIFVGDSITDLYPLDNYYCDLSLSVYNRGIGGDTTDGLLNRMEVSLFDLKPSKIVLMIGVNDIYGGGKDVDYVFANYQTIISQIETSLPEAEVYCMSIISQNEKLTQLANIDISDKIKKIMTLNEKIKNLVQAKSNFSYVDLFSATADENNRLIASYTGDGLHLNSAGFEVWTSILKPLLV